MILALPLFLRYRLSLAVCRLTRALTLLPLAGLLLPPPCPACYLSPHTLHTRTQSVQQQQPGRSPAYPPVSPALMSASPHHRTSPQHVSAPGSSVRSGSHEEQAAHIAASLDTLLQGLTRTGYLNDPALKATSFDPAFIKVVLGACLCAPQRICLLSLCLLQGSAAACLVQRASDSLHACIQWQAGGCCCSVQVMPVWLFSWQQRSKCVHVCSGSGGRGGGQGVLCVSAAQRQHQQWSR